MPEPLQTAAEPIRDYTRLSRLDEAMVLRLADDGRTQVEIAKLIGCSQSTVSGILADFADTRHLARRILDRDAADVAERLGKTKHAPTMLELMRDLGVTEKKAPAGESKGGVTVLIGVKDSDVQVQVHTPTFASDEGAVAPVLHSLSAER